MRGNPGRLYTAPTNRDQQVDQIRIALDGDAVIFSDESEQIIQLHGLEKFNENEARLVRQPLKDGPFAPLLRALSRLQSAKAAEKPPVRVALVTARGQVAAERVIRTLDAWKVRVDEAHFMDGMEKTQILEAFAPHIFFDDQQSHCDRAAPKVPTAIVPYRSTLPLARTHQQLTDANGNAAA